jgi:hypothetical protein
MMAKEYRPYITVIIDSATQQRDHRTAVSYDLTVAPFHLATDWRQTDGWGDEEFISELTRAYREQHKLLPDVDVKPEIDQLIGNLDPRDSRIPLLREVKARLSSIIDA